MPESFDRLPKKFGRYEVRKKLGEGGMGAVFLARDTVLDREIALKIPTIAGDDNREVLERLLREARVAAGFQHPNLCPVFDAGEIDGVHYIAMPFLEGEPLSNSIESGLITSPRESALLVAKIARGLHAAHEKGVVHRDLKPANIMIDARGEPIIMDFGLARRSNSSDVRLTQTGAIMGTPSYMSPEQVQGKSKTLGPATDIFSLGVILYELLAGRLPFLGSLPIVLAQIVAKMPAPPSEHRAGVPSSLDRICLHALAKRPDERYETALAFAEALEASGTKRTAGDKAAQPGKGKAGKAKSKPETTISRGALMAGGAAVAVLALATILGVMLNSSSKNTASGVAPNAATGLAPSGVVTAVANTSTVTTPDATALAAAPTSPAAPGMAGSIPGGAFSPASSPASTKESVPVSTELKDPKALAYFQRAEKGDLTLIPEILELGRGKPGIDEVIEPLLTILSAFRLPDAAANSPATLNTPGGFPGSPPGYSTASRDEPRWKIFETVLIGLSENHGDRAANKLIEIAEQKAGLSWMTDATLPALLALVRTNNSLAAARVADWIAESANSGSVPISTASAALGSLAQEAALTSASPALLTEVERRYLAAPANSSTRSVWERVLLLSHPDRIDGQVRLLVSGKLSAEQRQPLLSTLLILSGQAVRDIFDFQGDGTTIAGISPETTRHSPPIGRSSLGVPAPGASFPGSLGPGGPVPGGMLPGGSFAGANGYEIDHTGWSQEQRVLAARALWTSRFVQAQLQGERSQQPVREQLLQLSAIPATKARQEALRLLTGLWRQGPLAIGSLGEALNQPGLAGLSDFNQASGAINLPPLLDPTFAAGLLDPGCVVLMKQLPRGERVNKLNPSQKLARRNFLTQTGAAVDVKQQEQEARYQWMEATEQLVRHWCQRLESSARWRSTNAEGTPEEPLPFTLDERATVKHRYTQAWPLGEAADAAAEPMRFYYVSLESRLGAAKLAEHYANLATPKEKPKIRKLDPDRWVDYIGEGPRPGSLLSFDALIHKQDSLPGSEKADVHRVDILFIEIPKLDDGN